MGKRKNPRLAEFDYSTGGAYFVTVCTHKRQHLLSRITVGRGLAPAEICLSEYGKIVEKQLLLLEKRYENVRVDKYVIMPNHVHVIFILDETAGASPRPTVSDMVCTWKSLSTRLCKKTSSLERLWQASFYDHIIRDKTDHLTRWRYIDENPAKWSEDEYFP